MSAENNKACYNCRHCIRSHDEKYNITVFRCKKYDRYLCYAEAMCGWCRHWAKEKSESRKQANIGVWVAEGLKRGIQEGE